MPKQRLLLISAFVLATGLGACGKEDETQMPAEDAAGGAENGMPPAAEESPPAPMEPPAEPAPMEQPATMEPAPME